MLDVIRAFFAFSYGMILLMTFAGIKIFNKSAVKKIILFFLLEIVLQEGSYILCGFDTVEKIYPLIVHLPMWLFVTFIFKANAGVAFIALLSAYLCCELPNAASKILAIPFNSNYSAEVLFYCISCVVILYFLIKHVAYPLSRLFNAGNSQRLMFGSIPFVYYVWCYISSVYSSYLIDNGYQIALFMSALFCFMFLIFAITEQTRHEAEIKQNEAMAANTAKSSFLASMSHEIRTPINAVLGLDEMILRESNEPHIRDYAYKIKSSGNSLLYLINDILDLSKIEAGKMELVSSEYSLKKLITDVLIMSVPRMQSKGLDYKLNIDPSIPTQLHGDDMRLRQVLINLITNGVKYTNSGTVTLTVSLVKIENNNATLHFSVSDTGIGIKPEDIDKLFESFRRVDVKRNKGIEGTGLGLNITQRILDLMGSPLKLNSEYGVGSDFYFDLVQPVIDITPIGEYKYEESVADTGEIYSEGFIAKDAKVLAVDDYDMNLLVFTGLLKNSGMQIDTASSGKEALELIYKNKYDLVFMDHMMPDMDGIEVLKQINSDKTLKANAEIVIVLTANAISGSKEMYLAEGFNDYLVKPVVGETLEACIRKWLPPELIVDVEPGSFIKQNSTNAVTFSDTVIDSSELIDEEAAKQYSGGDKSLYKELLKAFVKSNFKDNLTEAFNANDWDKYAVHVHGLKSGAKSIGALRLSDNAKISELAIKEKNDFECSKRMHPEIMKELEQLIAYIEQNN